MFQEVLKLPNTIIKTSLKLRAHGANTLENFEIMYKIYHTFHIFISVNQTYMALI